jgi:hypothetical protein
MAAQPPAPAVGETFVDIPEPLVELLGHRSFKERHGTDLG